MFYEIKKILTSIFSIQKHPNKEDKKEGSTDTKKIETTDIKKENSKKKIIKETKDLYKEKKEEIKLEKKEITPSKKSRKNRSNKIKKRPQKKVNRHGIPVLKDSDDLEKIFSFNEKPDKSSDDSGNKKKISCITLNEHHVKNRKDKHGIPILKKSDDLLNLFNIEEYDDENHKDKKLKLIKPVYNKDTASEEKFDKLLESSLKKTDIKSVLQEKGDISVKKELSVSQRIKKEYPAPQSQIDLHGYTAREAEEKTVLFIKEAYVRRFKTLRIIVGKGLHSDGKAVLRDVVEDIIILLKYENIVLTFSWDKGKKSKSGSIVVYLR